MSVSTNVFADRGKAYEKLGMQEDSDADYREYTIRFRESKASQNENFLDLSNLRI